MCAARACCCFCCVRVLCLQQLVCAQQQQRVCAQQRVSRHILFWDGVFVVHALRTVLRSMRATHVASAFWGQDHQASLLLVKTLTTTRAPRRRAKPCTKPNTGHQGRAPGRRPQQGRVEQGHQERADAAARRHLAAAQRGRGRQGAFSGCALLGEEEALRLRGSGCWWERSLKGGASCAQERACAHVRSRGACCARVCSACSTKNLTICIILPHCPVQEEMYSFVTAAGDQTTKGKGPVVVQDS